MNNFVEIIYNKRERYPKISINGEQISRYMELADLIYDDIYSWAGKFYESMDDELCESYTVLLTGHPFQNTVLKAMQTQSQYCSEIRFTPITQKLPVDAKLAYATELNQRYGLGIAQCAEGIRFFTGQTDHFQGLVSCSNEPGSYYITTGTELPEQNIKLCVMVSDRLHFQKIRGISVLQIPAQLLNELVDYLNLYHLHLDFITAVFSAANDLNLSPVERLKYEAYLNEEYRILASIPPQVMNTGERFQVTYEYYPSQFENPQINVSTNNPGVLFAADNTVIAQNAGSANVILTDKFGTVHGNHPVSVEHHNYVSDISIILPATSLCVNEVMHLKCLISPNDAEDIHNVRYAVNDTSVAAFSGQNEIYGIAPGRVKVTVSTPRISKSVYLSVLPPVKDVLLPAETLAVPISANAYIECAISPANASPAPTVTWESSNPYLVKIVETNGYTCQIATTLQPCTAVLKCSVDGTDICKYMKVNVEKAKGCYVATAVYGSYDCPQVWMLRRYRDQFLASHGFGRAFIKVYYALSPTAVQWFGKSKWFNRLWRSVLDRKVRKLKERGYEDTPYND